MLYIYIILSQCETCELVWSFLLSQLQDRNINVGLYRDDGLAITNATPRDTENTTKEICPIFKVFDSRARDNYG